MISDKQYDTLKWIGLIAVPVITFLTAFVNIWQIPYGDHIVATLAAIDALIGGIVTIAKVQYEKQKRLETSEKKETSNLVDGSETYCDKEESNSIEESEKYES